MKRFTMILMLTLVACAAEQKPAEKPHAFAATCKQQCDTKGSEPDCLSMCTKIFAPR